MKARILAAALFAVAAAVSAEAGAQPAASAGAPVVVELYTSQGCTSCPRANRLLGQFARDPNVLALTFAVDYWDYLGWRDTFARGEFTIRQRDYARALRFRAPYTPQLVINGARQVSASDWDQSRAALEEVRRDEQPRGAPEVSIARLENNQVRVTIGGGFVRDPADIWLVSFDPGPVLVTITAGENDGRRVLHYNLVRRITYVGAWAGERTSFERSRCAPECAVLVQATRGGRILGFAYTRR